MSDACHTRVSKRKGEDKLVREDMTEFKSWDQDTIELPE
jgi:hypothetical protein